jgi:hypothetical protein
VPVHTAVFALVADLVSGDAPESGTAALTALASGASLSWPGGSVAGTSIGFRTGSKRIVAVITDENFHNDYAGGEPYSFAAPTFAQSLSALSAVGARIIGVFSGSGVGLANLEAYAVGTGTFVPPSAFALPSGLCGTAFLPAGRSPNPSGQCPLVYITSSNGTGTFEALLDGVFRAAGL